MTMIPFILFTVLTNAAAQLLLKQGMLSLGAFEGAPTLLHKLFAVALSPWIMLGMFTFVISMASHLYVLSKVELSFAYPFLSLAYVVVAVSAWLIFGENLSTIRVLGIALICVGTVLIAQSGQGDGPADALAKPHAPIAEESQS